MLTVDTSGLLALLTVDDPHHDPATEALDADPGPYLLPAGILAEVGYMVETRLTPEVLDSVLSDLESGAFRLDCGDADIPRVRTLVRRYRNLPLGLADAAVIACAERSGGRILTLDRRDFGVVARDASITIVP